MTELIIILPCKEEYSRQICDIAISIYLSLSNPYKFIISSTNQNNYLKEQIPEKYIIIQNEAIIYSTKELIESRNLELSYNDFNENPYQQMSNFTHISKIYIVGTQNKISEYYKLIQYAFSDYEVCFIDL